MRQKTFTHWSWINFADTHIVLGQNRTHRIPGTPVVDIIVTNGGERLEIRIQTTKKTDIPRDLNSMTKIAVSAGKDYLSISTVSQALFSEFYHMGALISDRVQFNGENPIDAVEDVLTDIRSLTAKDRPLTDTEEIGLFGEFWVLRRLIEAFGAKAVGSWIGPGRREHDFRIRKIELEVKTTTRIRRVHAIHGLGQLLPSPGNSLFLFSLHISPAGAGNGLSLTSLRNEILALLKKYPGSLSVFNNMVGKFRLKEKDWELFKRGWVLRGPALLIPSAECPSLTVEQLRKVLPAAHAARIDSVEYDINVEGLGFKDGTKKFTDIIPV